MAKSRAAISVALAWLAVAAIGCQSDAAPDYGRPLPPGQSALRLLPMDQWPDLKPAYRDRPGDLTAALKASLAWYDNPSTQRHFPGPAIGVTHDHAKASVAAFWRTAGNSANAVAFEQAIRQQFDCYTSVGWDGGGEVLFTGYYTPTFDASPRPTAAARYPLYARPEGLVSDEDGRVLHSFATRASIEASADKAGLRGNELYWLNDPFEVYLIHVQGSARLRLPGGKYVYVGYAGNNGHEYRSVGMELVKDGHIPRDELSVPAMWGFFRKHPNRLNDYLNRNPRFVFFQEYDASSWPAGSLGFPVTSFRSLATDKTVFPRGGVVLVETNIPNPSGGLRLFRQFMLDQDTGGAIRAAGRADIYMGSDPGAEVLAGRQHAPGRLYYFFLKPSVASSGAQAAQGHAPQQEPRPQSNPRIVPAGLSQPPQAAR